MEMLKVILPLAAVFVVYNFVDQILGLILLLAFIAGFLILEWPQITMLRGNSKYNQGDREGGLAMMKKAYDTGRLNSSMTVYYSYCLIRENKNEQAYQVLDKYISSGKGSKGDICRAKHNKAIMLWKDGRLDEAFDLMKEVHADMPATDTYGTLGLIYIDKANADPSMTDEAMAFMAEAYDYNADDRTIADNMGNMYYSQGRLEEADEVYKKLLVNRQPSPTPYYRYARVLEAMGNYEDAEDMLNKALRCSFTGVTAVKRQDVTDALARLDALRPAKDEENNEED